MLDRDVLADLLAWGALDYEREVVVVQRLMSKYDLYITEKEDEN